MVQFKNSLENDLFFDKKLFYNFCAKIYGKFLSKKFEQISMCFTVILYMAYSCKYGLFSISDMLVEI